MAIDKVIILFIGIALICAILYFIMKKIAEKTLPGMLNSSLGLKTKCHRSSSFKGSNLRCFVLIAENK